MSGGNVFLNEFFIPYVGDGFCVSYLIFFYKWKLLLKLVETYLFEKDFVPVERDFPPSGNCFLLFHSSSLQWPFLISK